MAAIIELPVHRIIPDPNQPRKTFPPDYIKDLAASIKRRGLIQAISVRPLPQAKRNGALYIITAGECRWRAHVLLKRKTIPSIVDAIDEREARLRSIVENLQRRDMNPIEEARAFQLLIGDDYSVDQIVEELGLKSPAIVRQRLDLLDLLPELQQLVLSGNLAVNMAWGVAQVAHPLQMRLMREIQSGKLRTSEQVKHAGIALRDAAAQLDAFASLPKASPRDLAKVSRLEEMIGSIAEMVMAGFQDGECVAAQRVSPDRVKLMADKLALIRKHVYQMEHALRCVATQTEIKLETTQ